MMDEPRRYNQLHDGWRRVKHLLIAAGVLWLTSGALPLAVAVNRASDPKPEKPIFQWLFSVVMVGLVCAVAFKNPKRSHQS
ncbi:MAG: hypothetical protein V2A79_05795 [Planctomycetota bacterium]